MKLSKRQIRKIIKEEKQKILKERMDSDIYKIVVRTLDRHGPKTHQELLAFVLHEYPQMSDELIDNFIDGFADDGSIIFNSRTQKYY